MHNSIPWELLYADDLIVIAETEDDLIKRPKEWEDNVYESHTCMHSCTHACTHARTHACTHAHTTVLRPSWQKVMQNAIRWPCGVCGRGVGNNSIRCTSCQKWVRRKCSSIKGSMYKVMKSFVCRGCVNPVTGTGCTSVDIGVNANLELVDKFCYLGDMLSVYCVSKKTTLMLHTIDSIHINRFRQFLAEMLLREYAIK